tara:strand:- start:584 stop:859 length:276 start_codon:yes stop_codon:yes gene_type:complete
MSQLHEGEAVEKVEEVVAEEVEEAKVSEVIEEDWVEEIPPLMTLNDVKDRFAGIVNNARAAGVATVTSRGFAAVESFLGALAGDKENRPKR